MEREDHAREISRMTHHADQATLACMIYSTMVGLFTDGNISLKYCLELCTHDTGWDSDSFYDPVILGGSWFQPRPTGYVVESFQCALHCLLTTNSFEDALIKAVNMGGDADTIGAITGGLAGAMYGFDEIPPRWLAELVPGVREKLDTYAAAAIENRAA